MATYLAKDMKHFNYLTSEIDAAYHEAALKLGLSDSAMLILYAVCSAGGECLLSDITRLSGVSKQTVNSALRKLEHENVVYLKAFTAKKKTVCLTDKGQALAKNTVLQIIGIENELLASWTEAERKLYLELTQRYLTAFRQKIEELPVRKEEP